MKKCYICEKEVTDQNEGFCETCIEFLKSKYGKNLDKHLKKWRSIEKEVRKK